MLCVSTGIVCLYCICSILLICVGGIISYRYLVFAGLKQQSELLFYCALVASILLTVVFAAMLLSAKKRTSELRRILLIARTSGRIDNERFLEFGSLGQSIIALFYAMQDISEKRSQRIRYLNTALKYVMSMYEKPMLLLDTDGNVLLASDDYFKMVEPDIQAITYGANIDRLCPGISFASSVKKIGRTALTVNTEKYIVQIIPVFVTSDSPDGYLALVQKNNILTAAAGKVVEIAAQKVAALGMLGDSECDTVASQKPNKNKKALRLPRFLQTIIKK